MPDHWNWYSKTNIKSFALAVCKKMCFYVVVAPFYLYLSSFFNTGAMFASVKNRKVSPISSIVITRELFCFQNSANTTYRV